MHKAINTIDEKDLIIEQAKNLIDSLLKSSYYYDGLNRLLTDVDLNAVHDLESAIKAHDKTYEKQFS